MYSRFGFWITLQQLECALKLAFCFRPIPFGIQDLTQIADRFAVRDAGSGRTIVIKKRQRFSDVRFSEIVLARVGLKTAHLAERTRLCDVVLRFYSQSGRVLILLQGFGKFAQEKVKIAGFECC